MHEFPLGQISLEDLRYWVIDEADTLFMKDFGEELMSLLEHLKVRFEKVATILRMCMNENPPLIYITRTLIYVW